jgi:hypothetical protein
MASSGDETGKKERMARNFQVNECNGDFTTVTHGSTKTAILRQSVAWNRVMRGRGTPMAGER